MQNFIKSSLCVFSLLAIVACTPVTAQRGNLVQDHQIESLQVGESTQSDVLRTLGSPTTQSTFNTNIWYYLGQETEKHGILDSEVAQERVVAVHFSEDGVIQSIESPDNQREDIPYARVKTPTHGNELTFTQQLLGNLGRFNGAGQ